MHGTSPYNIVPSMEIFGQLRNKTVYSLANGFKPAAGTVFQ